MTSTTTYDVIGMTCAHCVQAVTDEVSAFSGVRDVDIDLVVGGTSTVRVVSEEPLVGGRAARRPSTRRATNWSVRREAGRDARSLSPSGLAAVFVAALGIGGAVGQLAAVQPTSGHKDAGLARRRRRPRR